MRLGQMRQLRRLADSGTPHLQRHPFRSQLTGPNHANGFRLDRVVDRELSRDFRMGNSRQMSLPVEDNSFDSSFDSSFDIRCAQ